ncbi:MAG: hypothetical protein LUC43_07115 [Burkholderiales bacterium]|nr:hypothetical protein [Burkholderiales bacterium]
MFNERSSPAVVTAAEAKELPRVLLIGLLVAFILPQLFSSELWSGAEMSSFGVAWTMVTGNFADWLLPNIAGTPVPDFGPLTAWVSAIAISTLGKIFTPVIAYHLTSGIWYAIITASIWYAAYRLAKRDEAQPVSFAFGGEATRKDYGRLVADLAVLITISTYGLVEPLHEPIPNTALLALSALCFYGVVLSLEDVKKGSITAGISIGASALTATLGAAAWFTCAAWCAIFFTPGNTSRTKRAAMTLSVAMVTMLLWPLISFLFYPSRSAEWFSQWVLESTREFSPLHFSEYPWLLKNIAWITFPAWPFALWGIYAWRGSLKDATVAVPLSYLSVALFSVLFTGLEPRSTIFCSIPSLVVLAAFGIVSTRKSRENLFDLYSGVVVSISLVVAWIYYFAWTTGIFEKMAYSLIRLAPAVKPGTSYLLLLLALVLTILWGFVVYWRLHKHPVFAWRGVFLSATGTTLAIIVIMCLFGSLIYGAKSMDKIATSIKGTLSFVGQYDCVEGDDLSQSDRAAFQYLAGVKFGLPNQQCEYTLIDVPSDRVSPAADIYVDWIPIARVPGRPRTDKEYILYKRAEYRFPQTPTWPNVSPLSGAISLNKTVQ